MYQSFCAEKRKIKKEEADEKWKVKKTFSTRIECVTRGTEYAV